MTASDTVPTWFITGCSTGLGRALAAEALSRGHRVVATARRPETLSDLTSAHPDTALALALDVTRPDDIAAALKAAEARFGAIDVLVNNAGYGYFAAIEEGEDAAVRAMFEANVFGLFALARAALPAMRARRSGRIVNITSVGGMIGSAGVGYYNATKFAVEGFSEALAQEVAPIGIRVTAVAPGPFRTDWAGRSSVRSATRIADYEETAGARIAMVTGRAGNQPGDPKLAAAAIADAVLSDDPPLHFVLGANGTERVRAKLTAVLDEVDRWASVGIATDFPKGG